MRWGVRIVVATALLSLTACGGGDKLPSPPADLGGGATLNMSIVKNAFSLPAAGLSQDDRVNFEVGDSFFTKNWVTAPASTEARDGLGPIMNAQACSSCHTFDGRGAPPKDNDDTAALGLLLRLSVPGVAADGGPVPEPTYGGQLQDRSVIGVPAEGRMGISWHYTEGKFKDGTKYELRKPSFKPTDLAFGPLSPDVLISPRLAPQVIGGGLLESIPDSSLRAAADPEDKNNDGISGRVNVVPKTRGSGTTIGRFGWKANVADLEGQITGAFNGDIGITSTVHPDQPCGATQSACLAAPNGGTPELEDSTLGRIVFYNRVLAVPEMRAAKNSNVRKGAAQFGKLGCGSCHTATQRTKAAPVALLANQTFHPYTDLLLHDMGAGLADGRPDYLASGTEWRTAPLWGIGLIDDVNGRRFLLHDGRARTIDEAILWHGGEAAKAQRAFLALSKKQRAELLAFLEAL